MLDEIWQKIIFISSNMLNIFEIIRNLKFLLLGDTLEVDL